jgi:penicillin-binding protein 1C
MTRTRRIAILATVALAMGLTGAAVVLDAVFPPALERYETLSTAVLDADGRPLRGFTAADGIWRFAAVPGDVDPLYLEMLVAYEDKRFRSHPGVDPLALARAMTQWAAAGRPVSGASTLTMQTIRLLEPRPRTIASKLVEMARALQLEWHYGKDEILAIYLTLAPFGGNLEGVKAASRFYLGKEPAHLTPGEAALLVVLPQSPSRLRPDRYPGRARAARDKVLERMAGAGALSPARVAEARREGVPRSRHAAPFTAPHLARHLHALHPQRTVLRTPIRRTLQTGLAALARRHLSRLENGATIAALVVDNSSLEVRAYLGSADFLDSGRNGQVDMVRAVRSPGSTLKPFIYGIAFDLLGVHPETLISDRPTRFGDYAPVNFDRRYRGDVTVREALQLSLNVPAVAVLDRLGATRFARLVGNAGMTFHLDPKLKRPALPMALGGVGVSLWDLVTVYAGLARGGAVAPLRLTDTDPAGPDNRLLSEAAAWYLTSILEGTPPPTSRMAARHTAGWRRIAMKTGTSYGFRDAWAIGYDRDHTVGVWIGRPDGGFGSGRTGHVKASPVLYDIFDLLPATGEPFAPPPPDGVLLARTDQLPAPMRHLGRRDAMVKAAADGFDIAFPLDGAVLEVRDTGHGLAGLQLRASGGRRPLRWLIEGRPIPSAPFRRSVLWSPDGEGQARITVVDAAGRTATTRVWLRRGR